MANELLSDEKIQEAADKYAPVFEIDGKQLSKVEILQRQHARLRSIAMAQVDHLKGMGYVKLCSDRLTVIDDIMGTVKDHLRRCTRDGEEEYHAGRIKEKLQCQLKEILTGGRDEKV